MWQNGKTGWGLTTIVSTLSPIKANLCPRLMLEQACILLVRRWIWSASEPSNPWSWQGFIYLHASQVSALMAWMLCETENTDSPDTCAKRPGNASILSKPLGAHRLPTIHSFCQARGQLDSYWEVWETVSQISDSGCSFFPLWLVHGGFMDSPLAPPKVRFWVAPQIERHCVQSLHLVSSRHQDAYMPLSPQPLGQHRHSE